MEHEDHDAASGAHRNPVAVTFARATAEDFEELLALRTESMKESLERIGRFDPESVRWRFSRGFSPEHTRHVLVGGERVGFVTLMPRRDCLLLAGLFVRPGQQNRGVGGAVLAAVCAKADAAGLPTRVGTLRGSDATRFYERHGFQKIGEREWMVWYERPPHGGRLALTP